MSDAFEPRSVHRGRFRPFASFLMALRFLTRMPVPFVRTVDPPPLKDSMWMFPVVGAFVGTITGAALMLAHVARLPELFCGFRRRRGRFLEVDPGPPQVNGEWGT